MGKRHFSKIALKLQIQSRDLSIFYMFLLFGSVFKLSNRRPHVYKEELTCFKTSACLIQTGTRLNEIGRPLFKTGECLFRNRRTPILKQANAYFKKGGHVSKQADTCFKHVFYKIKK